MVGVHAFLRSKLNLTETGRITLRVLPTDLDFNLHMNNGRFLSVMDLGRIDLLVRMGVVKVLRANGWYPVVGAIHTTFRRSLYLFQRYDIVTNIAGWDDKWVYLTQKIESDGEEVAFAVMKTLFMSKEGKVTTEILAAALGQDKNWPDIPNYILQSMRTHRKPEGDANSQTSLPN